MPEIFKGMSKDEAESDLVLEKKEKEEALERLERFINGGKMNKWEMEALMLQLDIPVSRWMDEIREMAENELSTMEELERAEKKLAMVENVLANAKLNPGKNTGNDYVILTQEFDYVKKLLEERNNPERSA
ncbi:MAG: hypothetical protein U0944_03585 [Candidatus Moranbacteria bacterium]|nr:hypothetical protein [Candidatus Moranbacteria bacterium]MDZ4385474.1 hypothetical protein [Candidatus Moranbacteria bacterium]